MYDECSLFKNSFVYSLRAFFVGWQVFCVFALFFCIGMFLPYILIVVGKDYQIQ